MAQKLVKMIDLYKITKQNNKPLLGDLSEYDFMADYLQNFKKLDRSFIAERGNFAPIWNLNIEETTEDVLDAFREDVAGHLERHKENYKRLAALMSIEYSPLENYRMEENGTDDTDGMDVTIEDYGKINTTDVHGEQTETNDQGQRTNSFEYGAQSETNNIGAVKHTDEHGQYTDTNNIGAVSNTDIIGAQKTTVETGEQVETNNIGAVDETHNHGEQSVTDNIGATGGDTENLVSAFNSSSYVDGTKSINTEEAHTNTKSSNAYTDSDNISQHEDSKTIGKRTDVTDIDAHTDTHTEAERSDSTIHGEHTDTHEEDARIDTLNKTAYTDNQVEGAKTDILVRDSYTDTHEEASHQNTNSIEYGKKLKHFLTRFGNIGVTTSQQMAESEVSLWTSFNFYDIMFMMISKELLVNYDFGINLI